MEMVLTAALVATITLITAAWFKLGSTALLHTISEHELNLEAATIADQIAQLVRSADPLSFRLSSPANGLWSQLDFAAGTHHYAFSANGHQLILAYDELEPKVLSSHLIGLHFAFERNRLPTLLRWSVRLGGPKQSSEAFFSGVQYISLPAQ